MRGGGTIVTIFVVPLLPFLRPPLSDILIPPPSPSLAPALSPYFRCGKKIRPTWEGERDWGDREEDD